MNTNVIILAAGKSKRAKTDKQFFKIKNKYLIEITAEKFLKIKSIKKIILALSKKNIKKYSNLFKKLVDVYKINSTLAAVALVQFPKRIRKEKGINSEISVEDMERLFALFAEGKISREGLYLNMVSLSKGEGIVVNRVNLNPENGVLESAYQQSLDEVKKIKIKNKEKFKDIILGKMMYKLIGKVEAKDVISFLNKNLA